MKSTIHIYQAKIWTYYFDKKWYRVNFPDKLRWFVQYQKKKERKIRKTGCFFVICYEYEIIHLPFHNDRFWISINNNTRHYTMQALAKRIWMYVMLRVENGSLLGNIFRKMFLTMPLRSVLAWCSKTLSHSSRICMHAFVLQQFQDALLRTENPLWLVIHAQSERW